MIRCLLSLAALLVICGCAHVHEPAAPGAADTSDLMQTGATTFDRGQFEDAITAWDAAATKAAAAADKHVEADARTSLAAAQMMIGRYDLAVTSLRCALARAGESGDLARKARALNALGAAYTFNSRAGDKPGGERRAAHEHHTAPDACPDTSHDPETLLDQAKQLAEEADDALLLAAVLNNLGNYYARTFNHQDDAMACYAQAAKLADTTDPGLAAKASVNGAVAALTAFEFDKDPQHRQQTRTTLLDLNAKGIKLADALTDSHDKSFLLLTAGQTAEQLARLDPKASGEQRAAAKVAYTRALAVAERTGDLRSRSYACGYLGNLALEDGELPQAEQLTRRATLAAQQARLPDSLYRWQWQNARCYRARWQDKRDDDLDKSITFYAAATQPVQFIRNDISLGHGNARKRVSFRESIGSLYFEYADMLLRRAERAMDDKSLNDQQRQEIAALYIKAQSTVEQLKAVELENYFQDECVQLLKRKQKDVQDVDGTTAVVYLIPLADRTEILVSFKDRQYFRATSPANADQVKRLAEVFRAQISDVDQADEYEPYQRTGQLLYNALIAPIRDELTRRNIKTLVFVPDGPLRTIPMAALYDGQHHLIEDFALAITPGLELLEPKSIERTNVQLLASGLSMKREGFNALSLVPKEFSNIRGYYKNSQTLQDENFVAPKLERALEERPYSIVHVASHAVFGQDASESFLLTYDGKMKLDDIERLIRPYQLRDNPVELLTLSACQSAKGDADQERAALGIAGIAVKAGARSAVAALWSVDEEASLELMTDFYAGLSRGAATSIGNKKDLKAQITKAQAMREAQVKMLKAQKFNHLYYWGAFLVIGNWL